METYNFMAQVLKRNPKDLRKMRKHYIEKRKNGDHTYKTLTRIKLLTNKLLAITYQGE